MKITDLLKTFNNEDDIKVSISSTQNNNSKIHNHILTAIIPLLLSNTIAYAESPIEQQISPILSIQTLKDNVIKGKLKVTAKIIENNPTEDNSTSVYSTLDNQHNITCNFFINPISNQAVIESMRTITQEQVADFISLHEQAHCLHFTNFIPLTELNNYIDTYKKIPEIQIQAEESFADSFTFLMMVAKNPNDAQKIISSLYSFRKTHDSRQKDHDTSISLEIAYQTWDKLDNMTKQSIQEHLKNPSKATKMEEKLAKIASIAAHNGAFHFATSNFGTDIANQIEKNMQVINMSNEISKIFPSAIDKLNASRQKDSLESKPLSI